MGFKWFGLFLGVGVCLCCVCCGGEVRVSGGDGVCGSGLDSVRGRGVLRVVTVESAFSYYSDGDGEDCGYDYDLSRAFADYLGVEHELIVADDVEGAIGVVECGGADVLAYRLHGGRRYSGRLALSDGMGLSRVVLVQRRRMGQKNGVTELVGDTVYVRGGGRCAKRLRNLNDELGGGVVVIEVGDSLRSDDLILGVSRGDIDYCVVDEDLARLYGAKLMNINYSVVVGHGGATAWGFACCARDLVGVFNGWYASLQGGELLMLLARRYIDRSDYPFAWLPVVKEGDISPYDDVFRREAERLGWDWRLLAALAWNESHFNPTAMSSRGAAGIMQLMPGTAARFGLEGADVYDAERNIVAGVRYIGRLDEMFACVENRDERVKFILAGYNAGPGHVFDAMALAEKYGSDGDRWDGSVRDWLLKLNDERYYGDEVCRHGFFRGRHTVAYVEKVFKTYGEYCGVD